MRGFDDRSAPRGAAAFQQAYVPPSTPTGFPNPMLPFHLDTAVSVPPKQGECTNDVEHQWAGQHDSWNHGANDNWMNSHLTTEPDAPQAAVTMGYYNRDDLPFYYSLADHFTICDSFFCSMIAGTDINRLYSMTGTIDPDGWDGGCQFLNTKIGTVQNPGADLGASRPLDALSGDPHQGGHQLEGLRHAGRPARRQRAALLPAVPPGWWRPDAGRQRVRLQRVPGRLPARLPERPAAAGVVVMADLADTEHAPAPPEWGQSITHTC